MARLRNALFVALKWKYFIPATLALAFILRLLWVLTFDARPESDFLWYYTKAINLTQGHGFGDGDIPTAYNPIGYPLFLSLVFRVFGISVFAAQIANVVTQTFLVYAIYLLGREVFHSRLVGRMAMLLLAIYPNGIAYTSLLANESLYLPLYVIGCWLMIRSIRVNPWMALPAGLCIGYSSLCKPQGLLVAFIILLFAIKIAAPHKITFPRWLLTGVALCLGLAIVTGPWVWRNYQIWGHPVFNNTMGINMYLAHNPIATGGYVVMTPEMIKALGNGNEYEVDQQARKLAIDYIKRNPSELITLASARLMYLLSVDFDGAIWNGPFSPDKTPIQVAILINAMIVASYFYLMITILSILAVIYLPFKMRLRKYTFPTIGIWICLYFTGIILVYYGMPRYHAPLIPWMIIYSAAALMLIPKKKFASDEEKTAEGVA